MSLLYDLDWTPMDEEEANTREAALLNLDLQLQETFLKVHKEMKRRGEVIEILEHKLGELKHRYAMLRDDEEGVTEESTLQRLMQDNDRLRNEVFSLSKILVDLRSTAAQAVQGLNQAQMDDLKMKLDTLEANAVTTTRSPPSHISGMGYQILIRRASGDVLEGIEVAELAALLKAEGQF